MPVSIMQTLPAFIFSVLGFNLIKSTLLNDLFGFESRFKESGIYFVPLLSVKSSRATITK
jgi:hypothetical protein